MGAADEVLWRHTYMLLWMVAGILLGLGAILRLPEIGAALFAVFVGLGFAVDEFLTGGLYTRDDMRVHEVTSGYVIAVIGISGAALLPVVAVAAWLGIGSWPAWLTPVAFLVAAVYILYGLIGLLEAGSRMG